MQPFYLLLLLVACVCFVLAAFRVAPKVDFLALGLLAWALVPLTQTLQKL